jgi:isocitrate dehydrogenase (NAD+)
MPDFLFTERLIRNIFSCMQLVSNPWQFDVVILTNLYGTIVSNLVCGLIGGPGIIAGANFGPQYAVFETGTRNAAQVKSFNIFMKISISLTL